MNSRTIARLPRWSFVLSSLLLTLLFARLALDDHQARDRDWEHELESQGRLQTQVVQRAQYGVERSAKLIASTLANDRRVLELVRAADRAIAGGASLDDITLNTLRGQLVATLSPAWSVLQEEQGRQLQLYWGGAGIALLRMHDPDAYGDAVADLRPMLHAALHSGQPGLGLDVGTHGLGNRAIEPLRASDDPNSPIIGALEVGFDMLPKLSVLAEQLDAGLALIVNRARLETIQRQSPTGTHLPQLGNWLLDNHSGSQILRWADRHELPRIEAGMALRLLAADGRTFLLNQIPLPDIRAEQDPTRAPLAAALVWRDITDLLEEHIQAERWLLLKWALAWLIAEALLLALAILFHRRIAIQRLHLFSHQRQVLQRTRLLKREQKIARLLPGMVYQLKRFRDGRYQFLYVSEGVQPLYGLSPEQLLGDAELAFAAVHPEDLSELNAAIERSANNLGGDVIRYRIIHPHNGPIWVEGRAKAERLVDGTILWHGFITDVSELMQTTRALQESESRFRDMVSNLPGVVYRYRNDGQRGVIYLSDGIQRLTGYPARDFIGNRIRRYASLIHPDDRALARNIPEGHALFERTYRLIDANGATVWVREKGRRMADPQQPWTDGFVWDVTQQVLAEQALHESRDRLAALYRLAPVGIVLSRLKDGRLLEWNPELRQLSGHADEHLRGLSIAELFATTRDAERDPRQQLNSQGIYGPHETQLLRHDGSQVPVLLSGALTVAADGTQLIWSIIQDITERVRAEREAQERECYLRLLFANVIDAIIIIDQRGIIETFNHAAERIFGYRSEEAIGRNLSLLMPDPHRSAHDGYLHAYAMRGESHTLEQNRELTAQRRNGELFTIELRVSQISHHGETRFIGLVRDITERKRAEQMKHEFVSVVSHELRTPLTSIAGALGLVAGGAVGEVPASMRQMLTIAHQNSLRLGRLIDDLLDMDKLIAGKMPLQMRTQPLAPLLEDALRSNQSYAEQYAVRFERGALPTLSVAVDENRMHQVLANLLSNAAKFSPAGEIVMLIAERRGDWVRVSITDNGPGICEAFQMRIFEKFSQADSSDTRQKGGTGLGLAISKELVERMNGRMGFDTEAGLGTCFWFELPAVADG